MKRIILATSLIVLSIGMGGATQVWKTIHTSKSLKAGEVFQACIVEGNGGTNAYSLQAYSDQGISPSIGLVLQSGKSTTSTKVSDYQQFAQRIADVDANGNMRIESYYYSNNYLTISCKNGTLTPVDNYRGTSFVGMAAIYRDYVSSNDDYYRWKLSDLGNGLFKISSANRPNGFICYASRGSRTVRKDYSEVAYATTYCSDGISFCNQQSANQTFEELLTASGFSNTSTYVSFTPSASIQLPGAWTISQLFTIYSTTFDAAAGHFEDLSTSKVINDSYYEWPLVVAPNGYVHTGWVTGEGYDAMANDDYDGYYVPNAERTLYASFLPIAKMSVEAWQQNSVRVQYLGAAAKVSSRVCYSNAGSVFVGGHYSEEVIQTLLDIEVDNGVFDIAVATDELAKNAGKELVLTFYDADGEMIGVQQVTIPRLVTTQSSLSSQMAIDASHDVVVLSGQKLTVDVDLDCQSMTINPGGILVVNQGQTANVHELYLRGGDLVNGTYAFRYPQLIANGTVQTENDMIYYDYLLSNNQYYSLTLPYMVNTASVTYLDGKKALFGIQEYDGSLRLDGKSSGWVNTLDANNRVDCQLEPYKGYTIFAMPQLVQLASGEKVRRHYSALRFPMEADLHGGEATIGSSRSVSVIPHGAGVASIQPNDKGWNLVGNPYLANFNGIDGLESTDGIGLLEDNGEAYEWVDNIRYVVIPFDNGLGYSQEVASAITLPAFKNFFVQIGTGDALNFSLANRAQHAPIYKEATEPNKEWLIGLSLRDNEGAASDKMGVLIGEQFTDAYEINADLQKWFNKDINFYAVCEAAGGDLAYLAIPMQSMSSIRLGFTAPTEGEYTILLNTEGLAKEWESIELYDSEAKTTTNLLQSAYTFATTAKRNDTRFVLSLKQQAQSPTDCQPIEVNSKADIYDIFGRRYPQIGQEGIYIIKQGDNAVKYMVK